MLSDHKGIILEINKRKIGRNFQNTWILNETLLNNMSKSHIKRNLNYFEINENKNKTNENY